MPSTPASNGMTPPRRGGQNKVTPSAARPQERARGTSLIGLPQRFCEAKDLWEEETQAERSSRKERSGGPAGFAATRRQGRAGSPGNYSLSHAAELNNPSVLPLASHRLGGTRKTPPRSGNFPTMGNFQARRRSKSPPRRGKALWSAARFVCRMTLYACRSSSHKTRHAIFVGTLKARKHLLAPYTGEAIIRRGRL